MHACRMVPAACAPRPPLGHVRIDRTFASDRSIAFPDIDGMVRGRAKYFARAGSPRASGFWIPVGAGLSGGARVWRASFFVRRAPAHLNRIACREIVASETCTDRARKLPPRGIHGPVWEFPHFGYDRSAKSSARGARPCGTALANAIGAGGNHAGTERLGAASRDVDRRRTASWMAREARKR